jgi:predicted metal-dependent phosphoesterase TrpH
LGRLGGTMLICHTHYSFRYGTIAPKELIERAIAAEYEAIVIADINNTSAILNSIRLGQNKGLNVVPGIDFRNGVQQRFVAIAKNNTGFYELNELLTQHLHQKAEIPERAPKLPNCYIIYPFAGYSGFRLRGNEYVGVAPHEIFKAQFPKALKKQKLVAQYTATFRHKADFNAHRLLRAIDKNTLLSKLAEASALSQSLPRLLQHERNHPKLSTQLRR